MKDTKELELEKKLNQIDEKIKLKKLRIEISPRYRLFGDTQKDLEGEKWEAERELRELKKQIYEKYIHNPKTKWNGFVEIKNIKSFVNQGIKRGLEITNILFINKYDLIKIVKQLINKDLEKIKTQTDKVESKIREIDVQIKKCIDEKMKPMKGLNALIKQGKRIYKKLNEKEHIKNRKTEKQKKEVEIKIKTLPKFMDKIIKEVNKGLILENLEDLK